MQSRRSNHQLEYWNIHGPIKTFNHSADFGQLDLLLNRDAKILDYGCGYGRVSHELYDHFCL